MLSSSGGTTNSHLNVARCPLCCEPNKCALAADPDAAECWCDGEEFPDELLAQIPENAIRRTCVCQNCLEKYRESTYVPDDQP